MDSKWNFISRRSKFKWHGPVIFTVLFFVSIIELTAGVLVAPTSVILSDRKRTGRLTVQNPSDKPQEITIGFTYGIPLSDSLGNISLDLRDSAE